ncbi:MAG: hypothetical protein RLZZ623_1712 [Actinomycetota bacterium]
MMKRVDSHTKETDLHRFLVDHVSDVLIAAGLDGVVHCASESAASVFGVAPVALVGTSVLDLVHADDRSQTEGAVTHAQWSSDAATAEVRVSNQSSGEQLDMSMTIRMVVAAGAPSLLHVTFADRTAQRRTEMALRSSERRFRGLTSQTSELVVDVDLTGTITYVSSSSIAVLGHRDVDAVGRAITEFIHPDDFPDLLRLFLGQGSADPQRHRAIHADGSYRWLETLAQILTDDDGERSSVLLSSRDITDRLELERVLERERQLLTAIIDNVHAGVIAVDADGIILCANTALCHIFGTDFERGARIVDYSDTHQLLDSYGDPVDIADRPLEIVLGGGSVTDRMFVVGSSDGRRYEVVANAAPIHGRDGDTTAAVLTYEDVTALRSAQEELRRLATVDTLTDLPNRRHLVTHLEDAMRRNVRTPERLAVLFADLDRFKAVNDDYGHEAGDELLRASGRRLRQWLRGSDLLARYGGDEFVVVLEGDDARSDAVKVAERLEHEMSRPFALICGSVTIGSSVGIAYVEPTDTIALVLAKADSAMYQRKTERRSGTQLPPARPLSRLG